MRGLLLAVLLILLLATWWALRPARAPQGPQAEETAGDPVDYFVTGLDALTYDAAGRPVRRLQARRLVHHGRSNQTHLASPRLVIRKDDVPLWRIRAERGTLSGDRQTLWLHGPVVAERAATATEPAARLETSEVRARPRENYFETDRPATLTSEAHRIRARGMKAWLSEPGRILFLADTRARYVFE